ncbi:MAG: hypothetical protein KAS30_04495 [Candidatus Diapherotrites archaeon]|nr:hypothetical protein [Candidatus Diapherotrites archaeon]
MADINQTISQFLDSLYQALVVNIWDEFVKVIPGIVAAIIIVLIGWILARIIKQIVIKILQSTKVDKWIDEQNLTAAIGGKEVSALIGSLTKWYIIGIFLAQAVGWLNLDIFTVYLERIFVFSNSNPSPIFFSLLGGVVVMVAGLLVARYFRNLIEATTFKIKKPLGLIAEGIVLVFSGMLALTLVVGPEIANVLISLIELFLTPFIKAFAWVLAIVVGISILVNSKEELRKISVELKKSVK